MLVIVVVMFGVCWLPIHIFFLVLDFFPEVHIYKSEADENFLIGVYISVHWLAMSNSFANPIIYGFTNESFRADLISLLYFWCPCCGFLKGMLPRQLSSNTFETIVFRRQSQHRFTIRHKSPVNLDRSLRNTRQYRRPPRDEYQYNDREIGTGELERINTTRGRGVCNGHLYSEELDNNVPRMLTDSSSSLPQL
ncbi:hypothetical protein CHS0354_037379 [Potamilus streckersoni]|uniref:G-protein coupled receptors family 1 profile domain-containing protein n=1 Tax=Potamilus streckersoni TaxID=2493646 RepID=A0AAE0VHP0_9BIVA|nr:hypothetical protein CHS0354_037379 [Potamilus streckersoni]